MAAVIGALRAELSASIAKFQEDLNKAAAQVEAFAKRVDKIGNSLNKAGNTLSTNVTLPIIGLGAATLKVAGDFEAGMNRVEAATQAPADQIAKLRQMALELAPAMGVVPKEAAAAFENLAKNGKSTQEMLDGLAESTIVLAKSTGGELGKAADVATDLMNQFGIQARDTGKMVDSINGVLIASKLDFDNYRLAIGQAGGIAGAAGVSFEDFNAALASTSPLFASGSDAGTSFKTFLQRLVPQSDQAANMMEALNLKFFDARGNMLGMAEIAQLLKDRMGNLTEEARNAALTEIFGTDAMRTAVGLMKEGAAGIQAMDEQIRRVSGADQMAAKTKGLNGELSKFVAQLQALAISIADSGLLTFMTEAVRDIGEWIKSLRDLNPELVQWGIKAAVVAAVLGPMLKVVGLLLIATGNLANVIRVSLVVAFQLLRAAILGAAAAADALLGRLDKIAKSPIGRAIQAASFLFDEQQRIAEKFQNMPRLPKQDGKQPGGGVVATVEGMGKAAEGALPPMGALVTLSKDFSKIIPANFKPVLQGNADAAGEAKTTLEDLQGTIAGANKKTADHTRQLVNAAQETRSLGRETDELTRGPMAGLKAVLQDVEDRFASQRDKIVQQIEDLKALGYAGPQVAAQLGQLQAMLVQLEKGHAKAAAAAKAQFEDEQRLADLRAQATSAGIQGDMDALARARGDVGLEGDRQRDVREANERLADEQRQAALDLAEMEARRAEALAVNDAAQVARLNGIIGLQTQYYQLVSQTTGEQLVAQREQAEIWDGFADDLSETLDRAIVDWEWSLKDFANVFRNLANDLFIKPGTDALGGFAKGLLQDLVGGGGGGSAWGDSGFAGFFAEGGRVNPGQWGIVGDDGMERARWTPGGIDIEPIGGGRRGSGQVIQNFYTPNPDAFRASKRQIARTGKEVLGQR